MDGMRIIDARTDADFTTARELVQEYAGATGGHVCFQDLAPELERLSVMYGPPAGAFLLALGASDAIGCVAMRPHAPGQCELKRLYVRPSARGTGVGRQLTTAIIERAVAAGHRRMILDTLATMTAAQGLYRSLGFRPCAPHSGAARPEVVYMALDLADARVVAQGARA
jgi:ribosomal protein S18 acetylase RimI-like enzyme